MNVQQKPIEWLTESGINPKGRTIPAQLKDLIQSIPVEGQLSPILVDQHGTVIDGHRRLAAMKLLDMSTVWVNIIPGDNGHLFKEVAETTKRIKARDWLEIYLNGGQPRKTARQNIAALERIGGRKLLVLILAKDFSPSILHYVRLVCKHVGINIQMSPDAALRVTEWLIKHRQARLAYNAIEDGIPATMLYADIKNDKPIRSKKLQWEE